MKNGMSTPTLKEIILDNNNSYVHGKDKELFYLQTTDYIRFKRVRSIFQLFIE
jgi:hypothetical protein